MSNSKKKRDAVKRRLKPKEKSRKRSASSNPSIVTLDIHREINYITQLAQAGDSRIVTVGILVFFSTRTGDAWLLDAEDGFAICLCRDGGPQSFRVVDSPKTFVIEWTADFAIDGDDFIVDERSGRRSVIRGYPIAEISTACTRVRKSHSSMD